MIVNFVAVSAVAITLTACGGGGHHDDAPPVDPIPPANDYSFVPTPIVTGPIASESFASETKNYTFFATDIALPTRGYVEEEFFFEGKANAYDVPNSMGSSTLPSTFPINVITPDVPYKTRMVVRRPTDPMKFNGTVVIEWANVTDGFDGEYFWVQAKDYLIREGYAYIVVSAQRNGITNATANLGGLIGFSPTRYGSLDVTNGQSGDSLSYDIFSQTAKAARSVPKVLGGLPVKLVMGIGMSQSAGRLGNYINFVHQRTPIYDSILLQVTGPAVRDDLIPVMKVLSESEARSANSLNNIQDDTPLRHTWFVAGASHGDVIQRMGRTSVRLRDYGLAGTPDDSCSTNPSILTRPRTPYRHVLNAAVSHLQKQMTTGAVPPSAPRFQTTGSGDTLAVARDSNNNALGAIRLAHMEVPTAVADQRECGNPGSWVPFDDAKLNTLYTSHADYVSKVTAAVNASIDAGFVLPVDGQETIAEAEASIYGLGLQCGLYCLNASHFKVDFSSTGLLREHTVYYNVLNGEDLIQAVDRAHWNTAKGYSTTGSTAKNYFNTAISELQFYSSLVSTARAEGRLTETAANLLVKEANAIIKGLEAL
ncbi:hypothetical protein AGMMS50256_01230 [Betaproteobacteria bacterium]|nr:hypothetical protein AGMMS50256_01230 [Betaproteobacteria bacterium]